MRTNSIPLDALTEAELNLFYMVATGLRRQLNSEELAIMEGNLAEGLDLVRRYEPTGEWLLTELGERCAAVLFAAASEDSLPPPASKQRTPMNITSTLLILLTAALSVACSTSPHDADAGDSSSSDAADESSSDDDDAFDGHDAVGPRDINGQRRPTHPNPCDTRKLPKAV